MKSVKGTVRDVGIVWTNVWDNIDSNVWTNVYGNVGDNVEDNVWDKGAINVMNNIWVTSGPILS